MQLVRGCWLVLIVFASCRVPPLSCPVEDEERKRQGRTRQKDGHSLTVPSCCLSYCTPRLKRNKGTGGDICSAFPVLIRINDINNRVHFSYLGKLLSFLSISTENSYSVRPRHSSRLSETEHISTSGCIWGDSENISL